MISNSKLITEAYIDMSGTIEGDQVMDDKMHDGEKKSVKKEILQKWHIECKWKFDYKMFVCIFILILILNIIYS